MKAGAIGILVPLRMREVPPSLGPGEAIEGVVEATVPVVETEALAATHRGNDATRGKTYTLRIQEAGTDTIELRSHFFDAYLVRREGTGRVVAEDDDGLLGTRSRIATELQGSGVTCSVEDSALGATAAGSRSLSTPGRR